MSKVEIKDNSNNNFIEPLYTPFPDEKGRMVRKAVAGTLVAVMFQVEVDNYRGCQIPSASKLFPLTEWVNPVFTGQTLSVTDLQPRINRVSRLIDSFRGIKDNWNGEEAVAPTEEAISNALSFVSLLEKDNFAFPAVEDIQVMPYGTIVMDICVPKGIVSVEIGASMLGYFTDFEDGDNYGTEGVPFSEKVLPKELAVLLS